jgi:hypothetical protein
MTADEALDVYKKVYNEWPEFAKARGRVSEADTRANILDRILHEVLGWPRDAVIREPHSKAGYLDYKLVKGGPSVIVEAKAQGESFVIPYRKHSKAQRLKIGGALATSKEIIEALEQAHKYCAEEGIRFGVVTNGYSFIIFKAIREGDTWRNGYATVFSGFNVISEDFVTFWNLLSYESVRDGKLTEAFRSDAAVPREYHRPIDRVVDSDATYARNPINLALRPYVDKFFGDIASQDTIEVLKECYVHSRPVQIIDHDLNIIIRDSVPQFAAGANQLLTSDAKPGGLIEAYVRSTVLIVDYKGSVVLLMGGIGSGKTTFLKRFFRVIAPDLAQPGEKTFRIHVDFLGAPDQLTDLDNFLWRSAAEAMRSNEPNLEKRAMLEKLFDKRLGLIREIYGEDSQHFETKYAEELFKLASDNREFSTAAIDHCRSEGRLPLVVFDNVDQLGIDLQAHIFTTTEHLAAHYGCLGILVIREETFSAAQMQKQLTAYSIKPYHLSSPSFRELIRLRIDYATNAAAKNTKQAPLRGFEAEDVAAKEILDFFNLLRNSVFTENYHIVRLLEAISFGNMRLALQLFSNFLLSGATNMPKILEIFRQEGRYLVPFHEFAKSVILGDYRFYKETRSFAFNLFHVTAARNSSHFTALRVLHYLSHSPERYQGGEGFVDLHALVSVFVDTFDNEDDCIKTLLRMVAVNRQLAEFDTRRPDTLAGASSVRISSAGKYYLDHFVGDVAYLDLVWHDTPFTDQVVCDELNRRIHSTDLLERLRRVDMFLDYLERHENAEIGGSGVEAMKSEVGIRFMPMIKMGYSRGKKSMLKYVRSYQASKGEPFGQRLNLDGFVCVERPSPLVPREDPGGGSALTPS